MNLGDGIFMVDLMERGLQGRTGSYVFPGSKKALIETGGSVSLPHLLRGLDELGLKPEEIDYIIVTHIHLDHAGGTGSLIQRCPKAQVIVHPRGARHLIDPSRLVAGARTVYGDQLDTFYGEVLPVPEERVQIKGHGETLDLGDRVLTFYDTPGHAKHHFSIHDSRSGAVFTGDTAGVRFHPELTGLNADYILPSTSPSDFDPEAVHQSIRLLRSLKPTKVFHGHFGASEDVERVFSETERLTDAFVELAERLDRPDLQWEEIATALKSLVLQDMEKQVGLPRDPQVLDPDITLNSMGLLHWLRTRRQR